MTEQFANNASTTLNGAINNSTTTVNVTNGAPFSQSGTFRVIVDSEIMIVNTNSGNVFGVTRAQEGTLAASHASGAVITQIMTAGAIAQLKTDITTVGVLHAGSGNPNTFPSFIQGISSIGLTATTTTSVTAGHLLVAFVQSEGASTGSTPTDNLGTAYAQVDIITGQSVNAALYVGIAPSSGIVTLTGTQTNTFPRTSIGEYKNATTTIDNFAHVIGAGTVNVTVSVANSLVLGVVAFFHSTSFTPGTGFVSDFSGSGGDATYYEHLISSSGGTQPVAYSQTFGSFAGSDLFGVVIHPAVVPPTVGNDGDFYIDTLNKQLYGPRTGGVYTLIGTLN